VHWILKCVLAGMAAGCTAVGTIVMPTMATIQWWPAHRADLILVFLVMGFGGGWLYYLKGPQQQAQP
jgi:hypothetical protein